MLSAENRRVPSRFVEASDPSAIRRWIVLRDRPRSLAPSSMRYARRGFSTPGDFRFSTAIACDAARPLSINSASRNSATASDTSRRPFIARAAVADMVFATSSMVSPSDFVTLRAPSSALTHGPPPFSGMKLGLPDDPLAQSDWATSPSRTKTLWSGSTIFCSCLARAILKMRPRCASSVET